MVLNMAALELPAALFGLLNVYLAARASIWNWLFGIVTTTLYIEIFLNVKLYADMSLQGVFLLLQLYGYYQWSYGSRLRSALAVRRASTQIYLVVPIVTIFLFGGIVSILQNFTDSTTPYAQWMFNKKWLENWWLWILVDLVSVGVYLEKELYLTSVLYMVLLVIAVFGYLRWQKLSLQEELLGAVNSP
jgi:nicotinamide mononucleotide transporter